MANSAPLHDSCATSRQPWRLPRASLLLPLAVTLLLTGPAQGQPVAAPFTVTSEAAGPMCPTAMTSFFLLAPPETTIVSGPPDNTPSTSATFTFSASVAGSTFQCSLDGDLYVACTSPFTVTGLGEGTHSLEVQAVNPDGELDPSPALRAWTVDNTNPVAPTIDAPPDGAVISNRSPTIQGTGEANASVTLELGGSTYGPTPVNAVGVWSYTVPVQLAEGPYTVKATVSDAAGNKSPSVSSTFTVDVTQPDTTIVSGPGNSTSSTTAAFDFSSTEANATYQCSLDSAAFTACSDPATLSNLSVGTHTLQVRAVDPAGNLDASPASYSWTITQASADTDNDGIPDDVEQTHGTNPNDADSDDDGLLDGNEDTDHDGTVDANETDPKKPDTDNDGLQDGTELGLTAPERASATDMTRFQADADPATKTDPLDADTDDGSVLDGVEDTNKNGRVDAGERNPLVKADDVPPAQDPDLDGVDTQTEIDKGLDPNDSDTDNDGVTDGQDGLEDTDKDGTLDALDPDSDGDGVYDGTERGVTVANAPAGTNTSSPNFKPDADPSTTTDPRKADTDADGRGDGQEDADKNGRVDFGAKETDPNDADTDDGGVSDGDEAQAGTDPLDDADDFIITGPGCSASGGASLPWAVVLVLLALPLLRRREARGAGVLLGLLGVTLAPAAHAQPMPSPASQAIDVQRYKPGPGATDILAMHGAGVGKHLDWHLGASFNYAREPLGFVNPANGDFVHALVANQMTLDLMGSLSLFDRFELGVGLPLTSQSTGGDTFSALPRNVAGTGLGDVRLVPKAYLLQAGDFHLSLVAPVLLPTAGGSGFRGGSGVAVQPKLVVEWGGEHNERAVINVGATLRGEQQFRSLRAGNELTYGFGMYVPLGEQLDIQANVNGALTLTGRQEVPLEMLAAVGYRFTKQLHAHVGGGPGMTQSYGTPRFRLFAGLSWSP